MEQLQNLPPYHIMFASAQTEIINQICKDDMEIAKKIIIHNIIYAYTLWKTEQDKDNTVTIETINTEIEAFTLDKQKWEMLLIMEVVYQSKAGIKPTQTFNSPSTLYNQMQNKLQPQTQK